MYGNVCDWQGFAMSYVSALAGDATLYSALRLIAKKATAKNTGARGLRVILENILVDSMFEVLDPPNQEANFVDVVVVDEEAIGSVEKLGTGVKILNGTDALERYLNKLNSTNPVDAKARALSVATSNLEKIFKKEDFGPMKATVHRRLDRRLPSSTGHRPPSPSSRNEVKLDLWHNGFIRGYTTWYAHGERKFRRAETGECSEPIEEDNGVGCTQMILDIHNATFQSHRDTQEEQAPNSFAKQYYEMLEADDEPLYEGCQKFSTLEAATRLLNWKAECNVPEATYNRALSLFKDMLPGGNKLVRNFYDTKKILSKLDLPREKIHACKNHCMLFYGKVDSVLTKCKALGLKDVTCKKKMSKEMTWHHDHKTDSNKMVHPSDGKAWKHFDSTHPTFSKEIRNPLIKELKTLWNDGVETYDAYRKNNFNMKATLLWTVSDFPAYAMLSGWSTHDSSFYSFKSHDSHVFMQRLLPIAFRGMIPNVVWDALTELCTFFRAICSRVLRIEDLEKLQKSIVEIICKLEKIFPPRFFDSMEHLIVHLVWEALLGGPMQYRWMYLYERLFDTGTKRNLTNAEKHKAHTYILLNCEDVHPFLRLFDNYIMQEDPYIDEETLDRARDEKFAQWFKEHIQSNGGNEHLKVLARGPMRYVESHKGYFVNGYKFHTLKHGDGRVTHNSGVCVKGSTYNEFESDYYGLLVEVLEVNYHDSNGRCVVVLFKCDWFEPIQGVRVNRKHNLVDIKYKSKGCQNDPFILASQAEQVYYAPYPSMTKDLKDWWAVVKATPRSIYEVTQSSSEVVDDNVDVEEFFQENEMPTCSNTTTDANENTEIEEVGDLEVGDAYMEVSENEEEFVDTYENLEVNEAEEEFIDRYDDSDDENELALSDHSSDEDEVNLSDHSLNDYLLIIINWTRYAGIMARDNNSKGRGRGQGRGRSGNGGIIGTSSASDYGSRSGGRGRGLSGNIVIGSSSNVSGFGNQEDANYDNGSRSGGRGRGISGNIGIGGSSSNVSGFGNQEDANYDNCSRSGGRGRGISGNIEAREGEGEGAEVKI
ncbi:transposase, Ptta/En/Spm [Tanacetum coccineum]